jgi:hypothetical protein
MQLTDDESQIHSILPHMMVRLHGEKSFARAGWAATPVVLVRSLVPPLQLDLVTFDYRLHGRPHIG